MLNGTTGVISLKEDAVIDREVRDEYLLCVKALQAPSNRRRRDLTADLIAKEMNDTVLFVRVMVLDENDEGPKFVRPIYKTGRLHYNNGKHEKFEEIRYMYIANVLRKNSQF